MRTADRTTDAAGSVAPHDPQAALEALERRLDACRRRRDDLEEVERTLGASHLAGAFGVLVLRLRLRALRALPRPPRGLDRAAARR